MISSLEEHSISYYDRPISLKPSKGLSVVVGLCLGSWFVLSSLDLSPLSSLASALTSHTRMQSTRNHEMTRTHTYIITPVVNCIDKQASALLLLKSSPIQ